MSVASTSYPSVDVIAEALKAANIIRPPPPQPRKPKQPRKPRTLRPLLKVGKPCPACKIIISDQQINHKLVYDQLYVKCRTRFDDLQKDLLHVAKERDYFRSHSKELEKQLLQAMKERDYYKSHLSAGRFA